MNTPTQNKEHGFTLIEVILSIAILSIVSVVVLRLFVVSNDLNESSKIVDYASLMAVNHIEELKSYQELDAYLATHPFIDNQEDTLSGSLIYDTNFDLNQNGAYQLDIILTSNATTPSLYTVNISATDLAKEKALVSYTTKHYFSIGGDQ